MSEIWYFSKNENKILIIRRMMEYNFKKLYGWREFMTRELFGTEAKNEINWSEIWALGILKIFQIWDNKIIHLNPIYGNEKRIWISYGIQGHINDVMVYNSHTLK